jgi:hypothetical protein
MIAALVGMAAVFGAIGGWIGYNLGRNPSQPQVIVVQQPPPAAPR